MNDIESAKAAKEARESAGTRAGAGHTTGELADRAIKLYLATNESRSHDDPAPAEEPAEGDDEDR